MATTERPLPSGGAVHSVTIDARSKLTAVGITEVISYDVSMIAARCEHGEIVVEGSGLLINSFDQSSGKLSVEGRIDAVHYIENKKQQSFFSRILK